MQGLMSHVVSLDKLVGGSFADFVFDEAFQQDELLVFEANDDILNEFSKGISLSIRGREHEEAVLCSSNKTYSIKLVETSNTLLLLPKDSPSNEFVFPIKGAVSCHYELDETIPRVYSLLSALSERLYCGVSESDDVSMVDSPVVTAIAERDASSPHVASPSLESPSNTNANVMTKTNTKMLYRWADLQALAQASDGQLHQALSDLNAICIDGFWRLLDDAYVDEVFDLILATVAQRGMSLHLSAEDIRAVVSELTDYSASIQYHIIRMHASAVPASSPEASATSVSSASASAPASASASASSASFPVQFEAVSLDSSRIARFRAAQLFRASRKTELPYQAFLDAWADTLPRGVSVHPDLLQGIAYVDQLPVGSVWRCVMAVASSPPARFSLLLETRAKWTLEELQPYIRDLVAPNQTVEQLLLKHTRIVKQGGIIVYTKK